MSRGSTRFQMAEVAGGAPKLGAMGGDLADLEQASAQADDHEGVFFSCSSSVLLHPAFIHRDLSLTVFARAPVGTEVQLLAGTSRSIVRRIAVFGEALDERAPFSRDNVIGSSSSSAAVRWTVLSTTARWTHRG